MKFVHSIFKEKHSYSHQSLLLSLWAKTNGTDKFHTALWRMLRFLCQLDVRGKQKSVYPFIPADNEK